MKHRDGLHLRHYCLACLLMFFSVQAVAQTVANVAIASYRQGLLAFQQDRVLDSIRYFQEAIERNGNYSDAYRGVANSFYYLEEFDEAERYIQLALNVSPQDPLNLNLYGRILITQRKVDEAEAVFNDILRKEPFNINALIGLGELSTARGNVIAAREYYQNSLKLLPEDRRVLLSLAFIYRDQGRLSLAEDYLIAAVQADSQNPWAYFYAADFYLLIGDIFEAEEYARSALILQPSFIPALEILSRIYVMQAEYEQAMLVLNQLSAAVQREDELTLFIRATAEYHSNNVDAAIRTLAAVIRDNPDNEAARLLIEDILLHEQDFNDPQRLAYAGFHFTRAEEYNQRNQYNSALYHYHRGLTLAPFSVEGRRSYARFFREGGEYARYLNQLEFLKMQLNVLDTEISDDFETYTAYLRDSPSQTWGVNQFISERNTFKIAVFIQPDSRILHSGINTLVTSHIMDRLYASSRIEFVVPSGMSPLSYEPIRTNSRAEAFATARAANAQYYLVISMAENDDTLELNISLHLGRTGRELRTFRILRSGNTRIKDSVLQIGEELLQALPVRGNILKRNFETALINLGRHDGLTVGSELQITKPADLSLHTESPSFAFDPADILGRIIIRNTDTLISHAEVIPAGFFDRINIGDTIFLMPPPTNTTPTATATMPSSTNPNELYHRIRSIR